MECGGGGAVAAVILAFLYSCVVIAVWVDGSEADKVSHMCASNH